MVSENDSSKVFDSLLFPKIFRTFRMAIQPTKLIITFLALAIICLAGYVMDHISRTVIVAPGTQGKVTELKAYMDDPGKPDEAVELHIERFREKGGRTGVFSILWHFGSEKFHNALKELFELNFASVAKNIADCFKAVEWALRYHFVYCIIFFVIKLSVISIAGGAICRISALQFARGEKPGLTEALRFSTKRFTSFFTAPLAPVGIIIFPGLFIFLLGLIGNIPWAGELIIGILVPLALIAGALITVVLIGAIAGFSLMFPAVAYDGSDCFDAISRSFSYIYAKPWRMGFYAAIAAVYGAFCYTFVRFFAFLLLWVTHRSLQLGVWGNDKLTAIWAEPHLRDLLVTPDWGALNWPQSIAAFLIYLCSSAIVGLLVSFIISFYLSANTIIYSLMRNKVDNTALEDVYKYFDEAEIEPSIIESQIDEEQPDSSSSQQ